MLAAQTEIVCRACDRTVAGNTTRPAADRVPQGLFGQWVPEYGRTPSLLLSTTTKTWRGGNPGRRPGIRYGHVRRSAETFRRDGAGCVVARPSAAKMSLDRSSSRRDRSAGAGRRADNKDEYVWACWKKAAWRGFRLLSVIWHPEIRRIVGLEISVNDRHGRYGVTPISRTRTRCSFEECYSGIRIAALYADRRNRGKRPGGQAAARWRMRTGRGRIGGAPGMSSRLPR